MQRQKTALIGFFSALSMMIGSMIGIGIFLKNNGVFRTTNFNAISTLVAWIIAGIICLFLVISYAQICLSKMSRLGLAGWAEHLGGQKLGKFVKGVFSLYYFGIYIPGLGYFAGATFLSAINNYLPEANKFMDDQLGNYSSLGIAMVVTFLIYMGFLWLNYLSIKASSIFQKFSVVIKFLPLIIVTFAGIVFGAMKPDLSLFNTTAGQNPFGQSSVTVKEFSFPLVITSLPSIFFAFDSFLNVGSLALDMKKPKKHLPIVLISGMIIVSSIYISVTIGQIMTSQGVSWNVFGTNVLTKIGIEATAAAQASKIIENIFWILIFISVLGVVNGFSISCIRSFAGMVEEKLIVGAKFFAKISKYDYIKAGFLYSLIVANIWAIPYLILTFVFKSDSYIDGITNFPTLFFFVIYASLLILNLKRRIKDKEKWNFKNIALSFFEIISFLASIGVVLYQLVYVFSYVAFDPATAFKPAIASWGFVLEGNGATNLIAGIVFIVSLILFFAIPLLNMYIVNKTGTSDKSKFFAFRYNFQFNLWQKISFKNKNKQ